MAEPFILWEGAKGTASRAPTLTLAAGFVALYPPYTGFHGHDGAWPSEGEHAVRLYRCLTTNGVCRGPEALCTASHPPRLGARGLKAP